MMNESGLYTIKDVIFNGDQDPEHNAIECPGYRPLTYRDLRLQVLLVVKTLNARGFRRNDRIAIITPAGPETAVAIISVMAGFTTVPLNPQNREQEYKKYFSKLKIKAIIVQKGYDTAAITVAHARNIPVIELIPGSDLAGKFDLGDGDVPDTTEAEFASPQDTATLILTSGTTSAPKVVPLSQRQFCISAYLMIKIHKYTPVERHLVIVPYYHITGTKGTIIPSLLSGGTVICTKDFIPSDFPFLLKAFRPTDYNTVPAMHQGILRELRKVPAEDLKNNTLRGIRSGSASLPIPTNRGLEQLLGIPVSENYAMSETGTISVNFTPGNGSVGIPVIDSLAIIDENGNALRPGETGEIVVKGETVFSGYEDAPDENAVAFINGWFRTGDMGYLDHGGSLFLTGRKKEMINKGGEKISPVEIDSLLRSHPGVKDAMAFAIGDPVLGEDVAAMVVPADETVTEADLRIFLLDHLVQFKVPKRIFFADTIPRNPSGKPLRYEGTKRYS